MNNSSMYLFICKLYIPSFSGHSKWLMLKCETINEIDSHWKGLSRKVCSHLLLWKQKGLPPKGMNFWTSLLEMARIMHFFQSCPCGLEIFSKVLSMKYYGNYLKVQYACPRIISIYLHSIWIGKYFNVYHRRQKIHVYILADVYD